MRMRPVDRLPVWPKIIGSHNHYIKLYASELPRRDLSLRELNEYFGSDELMRLPDFIDVKRRECAIREENEPNVRTTVYITPIGETRLVHKYDAGSTSWHPVEFPVSSLEDIRIMTRFYADAEPEIDEETLREAVTIVEDRGETASSMSWVAKSPLMLFVEQLAGVEDAHYLLADYPEEVEELFETIHRNNLRRSEMIADKSPADAIYFIENTSTSLISPDQFKKYCFRHLEEYGQVITGMDRIYALHMCGHLKALLPDLAKSSAHVFEAFTSPTLADTRFVDGRGACPDTCLVGGTNAVVWTWPVDRIIDYIRGELDVLPHHRGIIVTSAGVLPPLSRPETVKRVCEWVRNYPVRN
jgi:hypothetical protein